MSGRSRAESPQRVSSEGAVQSIRRARDPARGELLARDFDAFEEFLELSDFVDQANGLLRGAEVSCDIGPQGDRHGIRTCTSPTT